MNCEPTISFQRVDPTGEGVVSTGENFRRTREYYAGGVLTRDLIKMYGIRLLIKPQGVGAKFDFSALYVTVGSGLGLLALAALVTDCIVNYLHFFLCKKAGPLCISCKKGLKAVRTNLYILVLFLSVPPPLPKSELFLTQPQPCMRSIFTLSHVFSILLLHVGEK